jgi:hypothetical protein
MYRSMLTLPATIAGATMTSLPAPPVSVTLSAAAWTTLSHALPFSEAQTPQCDS